MIIPGCHRCNSHKYAHTVITSSCNAPARTKPSKKVHLPLSSSPGIKCNIHIFPTYTAVYSVEWVFSSNRRTSRGGYILARVEYLILFDPHSTNLCHLIFLLSTSNPIKDLQKSLHCTVYPPNI